MIEQFNNWWDEEMRDKQIPIMEKEKLKEIAKKAFIKAWIVQEEKFENK